MADDFSWLGTIDPNSADPNASMPYDPGMSAPSVGDPNSDPFFNWLGTQSGAADPNAGGGAGGGGSPFNINSILDLVRGGIGLSQAHTLQGMAQTAFSQANPFGQYRPQYGAQLAGLMANPGSIVNDPGYKFSFDQGQQAVERGMAAQGFLGSGNEAIALQKYGMGFANDYLHQQEQFLSGLAGANINPANASAGIGGYGMGTDIAGQALAMLGYGAASVSRGGASAGTPAYGGSGGRPNAAGGEAAAGVGLANSAYNLYSNVTNAVGGTVPDALSTAGGVLGAANDVFGIYSGLQKGGVQGYATAAIDATQLASAAGLTSDAVGAVAGDIAAPLALYNFASNLKPGATGRDTLSGAEAGAAIGSIVPGVGTLIGAGVGALVGAAASAFGGKDTAKEAWQGFTHGGYSQQASQIDPTGLMWALGGLWRSHDQNFPGIRNFGDGNQFSTAMADQIANAIASGKITSSTDPSAVYQQVVGPWLASLPGGANWQQSGVRGQEQILVQDLITNYMAGKPITWGEATGGKAEYAYTPVGQVTAGGHYGTTSTSAPATNMPFQGGFQGLPGSLFHFAFPKGLPAAGAGVPTAAPASPVSAAPNNVLSFSAYANRMRIPQAPLRAMGG